MATVLSRPSSSSCQDTLRASRTNSSLSGSRLQHVPRASSQHGVQKTCEQPIQLPQQQWQTQWQQMWPAMRQQQQQQSQRNIQLPAICSWDWQMQAAHVCLWGLACAMQLQVLVAPAHAVELVESNLQSEGNVPSELSAAGEQQGPPLSSLMQGSNKKQIEGCTRRCVPTCIRGGEGSPGLGPISLRREIVVFKDGFRSRQYCLSECAQVCKLISDNEQQQQQQQQRQP